jgi:hypothetical protein
VPLRIRKKEDDLSLDVARSLLSYDPMTGALDWKRPPRRGVAAGPAGHINSEGYRIVGYNGHEYMAVHLIWFLQTGEWPVHGVDHEDRNQGNDKWSNLRPATCVQNNQNRGLRKDNSTGVHGVGYDPRRGNFHARIRVDGKSIYLGGSRDLEVIAGLRRAAEIKHFGEFSPLHGEC